MQLSRDQVILISAISAVVLLLTVGAVLFLAPGEEAALPEPTATAQATASATAAPTATFSPSPTAARLPLVPLWDTPLPTREP